jgi:hypothetical protein
MLQKWVQDHQAAVVAVNCNSESIDVVLAKTVLQPVYSKCSVICLLSFILSFTVN